MKDKRARFQYRAERTRESIRECAPGVLRLSVHRSSKFLYAQVIDDAAGRTIVSASSRDKDIRGARKSAANVADAKTLGTLIAEKALKAGVMKVVFDRGGNIYHGRVKALADAARASGLRF